MRIDSISKLISLFLILVMLVFVASISWSLNHLNDAFKLVEEFGKINSRISRQIQQPINAYLDSADALLLTKIDNNINQLIEHINLNSSLNNGHKTVFTDMLKAIGSDTVVELRAAGKLADPQLLLIHNENQLSAGIAIFLRYVEQSDAVDESVKHQYLKHLTHLQLALHNLSKARYNYFQNQQARFKQNMLQQGEHFSDRLIQLQQLPPLSIQAETESDDMADLMGWDEEQTSVSDQSAEQVEEFLSLIKRYPKELSNASVFLQQKQAGRKNTSSQMLELEKNLEQIGLSVIQDYQSTERGLYLILFSGMVLIVGLVVLLLWLKIHLANIINQSSQNLYQLANGDLNNSLDLNSRISEVGQLKEALTGLRQYFVQLINKINQETETLYRYQEVVIDGTEKMQGIVGEQQQASELSAQKMRQLCQLFQENMHTAVASSETTHLAQAAIDQGVKMMQKTREKVDELSVGVDSTANSLLLLQEDAKAIEGVLNVIETLTEQTNLLALNAAIEAARAGSHGRGFAVVADEVRKLASHTASSASEIQTLVEKLNVTTRQTVQLMQSQQSSANQTREAVADVNQIFSGIYAEVSDIHQKSSEIVLSSEKQSEISVTISEGIFKMEKASAVSLQEAEKNRKNANALSEVSESLQDLVQQFSI